MYTGLPAFIAMMAKVAWLDGGVAIYTAVTSGSSMSCCGSVYHRFMSYRLAYDFAFASLRLITATTFEPGTSLNAGPDFFSVTSPQPINPQPICFMFVSCFMSQKLNRCLSLGVSFLMSQPYFCHRIAFAVRSDCVRCPIRLRPPSDQIAFAVQSDCVRRPIRLRSPSDDLT